VKGTVPDFLLAEWLATGGEDRDVEVKGTVPDFLLREWLDNWRGRQKCRSEENRVTTR
jgi:hypothetical protein